MERTIKLSDLRNVVDEAYEQFKSIKEGTADSDFSKGGDGFGVTLTLVDGTEVSKGDTETPFTLGSIVKVPLSVELLSQYGADELVKKSGRCGCCHHNGDGKVKKPEGLAVSAHGVRAVSAVEPSGDPEGKMDVIISRIVAMTGSEPVLDDTVYKKRKAAVAAENTVDRLAEAGYYLYDDAALSIDIYAKLESLTMTTRQVAMMGATVAADGRNPVNGVPAFDGAISQNVMAMMAVHGPHKLNKAWLVMTGLPAKSGRGGGMLAILPGVLAIAAYSPELNEMGTSVKAARAIAYIAKKLDLNAFASAKVRVEK